MDDQAEQRRIRHEMLNCLNALRLTVEMIPLVGGTHMLLNVLDDIELEADRITRLLDQSHMTDDGEDAVHAG